VSDDDAQIRRRHRDLPRREWVRCERLGREYAAKFPHQWRNGSPYWSQLPIALPRKPRRRAPVAQGFASRLFQSLRVPRRAPAGQGSQPLDCTGAAGVSAAAVRRAQEAWARYLGRNVEQTVEISDGVTMTFVLVPPGRFLMGSPEDEEDRCPDETLHTVVLTEPFDVSKTEVTRAQYKALTGKLPVMSPADLYTQVTQARYEELIEFKGSNELPVDQVSWEEARDYGTELTEKLSDQHVYRLLTEAEWEYACRGGRPSSQPFGIGDGRSLSSREANFDGENPYGDAAEGDYLAETREVGSYTANALGLHDMHGNLGEWCADTYGPYPSGPVRNPTGPSEGSFRVIRGGGWLESGDECRAAFRRRNPPGARDFHFGFRLARSVPSGGK